MGSQTNSDYQESFSNPVHTSGCADPFVLKYLNEYWCYSTGIRTDRTCFGVFHSRDLVHWRELGGVMDPVDDISSCYWAPEVIYENGRFLMYYSVGDGVHMHIRAAIADDPAGPFRDAGRRLTSEEFAIDPHVFRDEDGVWYLFYATDFLEHTHIGTGTVCDVMQDPFMLMGVPRPVARARFDWQVFDPQRMEKGGVRWHTVEGPFVLKRKDVYYQMFSGGNWRNESYGVAYAVSENLSSVEEWDQVVDGEDVLPILRTIPGVVIGPGHNSAVRGPDNLETFCIYHRWSMDLSKRVLSIDRLEWAGRRLLVMGATSTPQPAPNSPSFVDFFDRSYQEGLGNDWRVVSGDWLVQDNAAVLHGGEPAEARCRVEASHFIAEVSLRLVQSAEGACGIKLASADETLLRFQLFKTRNAASICWQAGPDTEAWSEKDFELPHGFNIEAYHLIRVEADTSRVSITLDDYLVRWEGRIRTAPRHFALIGSGASVSFRGFALTEGWQDLFVGESTPRLLGWEEEAGEDRWLVTDKALCHSNPNNRESLITKEGLTGSYELVINVKLCSEVLADECCGFLPALEGRSGPLLTIERLGEGWVLRCDRYDSDTVFYLPDHFDPFVYNQFRFRKVRDQLLIQNESQLIGKVRVPETPTRIGLYASGTVAAFDMVRLTALRQG